MTCGWTRVCRPVFRKLPSSNYRQLLSFPLYDVFWLKMTHFWLFFAHVQITHPCLWKICRKRDPCLEKFGLKNPTIWAAHTRTLNMLCYPIQRKLIFMIVRITIIFNRYFLSMHVFDRVCPKVFLSEILEKASESFLSEVVFLKLFRPKVFYINVCCVISP